MKKRKTGMTLSRKLALMVIIFALLLFTSLIALSIAHYYREMYEKHEEYAVNIAGIAASQLDPDKIQTYLDSGVKDEEYDRAYETLCKIRENGGVQYLYVVKPEVDEVWYVLDTDPTEGAIPLGYHEPYYEGTFAENAEKMARGEPIPPIVSNEEYGWLLSVYYPMRTSDWEPAGYVGVDLQMTDMMTELQHFAQRMVLLALLLTAGTLAAIIFYSNRTIAQPIKKLSTAAKELVEEEQSGRTTDTEIFNQLTIRSNDEIGELYDSLSQMEHDMNAYIRDLVSVTSNSERILAELSLARRLQASMLPHVFPPFPDRKEFDLYATMAPAREVGGDFYDFFLIDDDHLCMVMADVSGKGIPAALFMMVSKIILQSCAMLGRSVAEILTKTNEALCSNNQVEMFVTVWLGILELSTGRLTAANAGHEYPVLKRADSSFELYKDKHGFILGGMDGVKYKEYELQLKPGEKLFVYTDGVTEATDTENNMFGVKRMINALNEDPDAEPKQILKNVHAAIDDFVQAAEQFDDITMLCIEYHGQDKAASRAAKEPEDLMNELIVEALEEKLPEVLAFVDRHLERVDCPMKAQMEIDVAVEEIFVNIASYAYAPGTGDAGIRVETSEDPAAITIIFSDRGVPYDPLKREDPDVTLSAEERDIGGLGIFMTKKFMDKLEYEFKDGQNILTLTKLL